MFDQDIGDDAPEENNQSNKLNSDNTLLNKKRKPENKINEQNISDNNSINDNYLSPRKNVGKFVVNANSNNQNDNVHENISKSHDNPIKAPIIPDNGKIFI